MPCLKTQDVLNGLLGSLFLASYEGSAYSTFIFISSTISQPSKIFYNENYNWYKLRFLCTEDNKFIVKEIYLPQTCTSKNYIIYSISTKIGFTILEEQ